MAVMGFEAYALDDYDTKKKMVSVSFYSNRFTTGLDLTRKQAKALVKSLNEALEKGKK